MTPIRPGPQRGYRAPGFSSSQPVTGNGRPREQVQAQAQPAQQGSGLQGGRAASASPVPAAPPIPQTGFRIPWYGMNNPAIPQPEVVPGKPSYNSLTGEWFLG